MTISSLFMIIPAAGKTVFILKQSLDAGFCMLCSQDTLIKWDLYIESRLNKKIFPTVGIAIINSLWPNDII